jgi:hypothetical protein
MTLRTCYDCKRMWEKVLMEPLFESWDANVHWYCPDCWDDIMANRDDSDNPRHSPA